jgi:hypothetical protein
MEKYIFSWEVIINLTMAAVRLKHVVYWWCYLSAKYIFFHSCVLTIFYFHFILHAWVFRLSRRTLSKLWCYGFLHHTACTQISRLRRNTLPPCSTFKDQVQVRHCSLTKASVPTFTTAEYQNSECHSHNPHCPYCNTGGVKTTLFKKLKTFHFLRAKMWHVVFPPFILLAIL